MVTLDKNYTQISEALAEDIADGTVSSVVNTYTVNNETWAICENSAPDPSTRFSAYPQQSIVDNTGEVCRYGDSVDSVMDSLLDTYLMKGVI